MGDESPSLITINSLAFVFFSLSSSPERFGRTSFYKVSIFDSCLHRNGISAFAPLPACPDFSRSTREGQAGKEKSNGNRDKKTMFST